MLLGYCNLSDQKLVMKERQNKLIKSLKNGFHAGKKIIAKVVYQYHSNRVGSKLIWHIHSWNRLFGAG